MFGRTRFSFATESTSGKVIQEIFRLQGRVDDGRFSPDRSCWSIVAVMESTPGTASLRLKTISSFQSSGCVSCEWQTNRAAAFSSDGNEILIGSENGTVRVYRLQTATWSGVGPAEVSGRVETSELVGD